MSLWNFANIAKTDNFIGQFMNFMVFMGCDEHLSYLGRYLNYSCSALQELK